MSNLDQHWVQIVLFITDSPRLLTSLYFQERKTPLLNSFEAARIWIFA